jgi:hypothetical protein
VSDPQYDEPGSRTRQAWLRSALGMVAVAVLIERGLAARGMPRALGLVALAPAVVFVALAARRSVELGPHDSAGPRRFTVLMTAGAVIGLGAVAAASVLVT